MSSAGAVPGTDPRADLGGTMRAARVARGLSLRALAQQVGMSPSSLSEFETGKSRLGDERLSTLSAALGVPLPAKPVQRPAPIFRHWRDYDEVALDPISAAALELFVARGYHGASVRMIAAQSDLTVAGVYHHVPSKQELLARLMRRAMAEMLARCAAADAEAATPRLRLSYLTEAMVGFHIHRLDWATLAARELRSLEPATRDEIEGERRRVLQLFVSAVADGRLVPGPVPDRVAARAIVTMCTAIPDWYVEAHRPDPAEVAAQYAAIARDLT